MKKIFFPFRTRFALCMLIISLVSCTKDSHSDITDVIDGSQKDTSETSISINADHWTEPSFGTHKCTFINILNYTHTVDSIIVSNKLNNELHKMATYGTNYAGGEIWYETDYSSIIIKFINGQHDMPFGSLPLVIYYK